MAHIPYGYSIENGKATLDTEKAHQIKLLFEEYVSGSGLEPAAEKIGIRRQHASLGRMIENKFYMGDDFYPAIVGDELWNKAQDERKRRAERLGRNKNYFARDKSNISAFWGLIFCSECNSDYRRYADNGKERWKCSRRIVSGKLCCNSPMISESEFEAAFMRIIGRIDLPEITAKPTRKPVVIEKKYDDPFKQAEYAYSQADIDDFDYQTKKLLTALERIPEEFDGDFMQKIIKRIEVLHGGTATFVFINDKNYGEELNSDGKA